MTLIKDENTYADVEFADKYINERYVQFNPIRVHYSVLSDEEKESYLMQSLQEIERLPFIGRKYSVTQALSFPRYRKNSFGNYTPIYLGMFVGAFNERETPECVKEAQVENALAILNKEISAISDRQFMTMQSLGAVKNTKYNKREAGDLGFGEDITGGGVQKKCPITSAKAYALLREWLGGIAVC